MNESEMPLCPNCKLPVLADFYYCPNCSQQLRPKPISVSLLKQIGVYLLSFFLPPFGLYPAIKYIRQSDPKTKIIGWVAIALTVISIMVS
ncbi:MAG TPA: zinc ribbon domain-containing protein, partial [Patescibacteria group bacterium]